MQTQRPLTLVVFLLLLTAFATASFAAPPVTLEQIMAHPDWISRPPEDPYWGDDDRAAYYQRKQLGKEQLDLWRVDVDGGEPTLVPLAQRGVADAPGQVSRDRRWKIWSREGDLFLKDLQSGTVRQITRTNAEETDPTFLFGDKRIWYQRGDAIFVYDIASGLTSQPAELLLEDDPADKDDDDFLHKQQSRLFDILRDKKRKEEEEREADRAARAADPTRAPLPWHLGDDVQIEHTSLSPTGRHMLVATLPKEVDEGKKTVMPEWITESGYVNPKEVRSKVGTGKPVSPTIWLLDLDSHQKHEIDLAGLPGIMDDPLKAIREKQEAKEEKDKTDGTAGKGEKDKTDEKSADCKGDCEDECDKKCGSERAVQLTQVTWSRDGRHLALQLRAYDNKDRWLATLDPAAPADPEGNRTLVNRHRLTDPAWINWDYNDMGWLEDNATLWLLSEESGWSQLHLVGLDGRPARALTSGKFEVSAPVLDHDGRFLYYTANAEHPGRYDVWRVEVATGRKEQLTRLGGLTEYQLSPRESRLLLLNSQITRPFELFVQDNRPGAEARRLTQTVTAEFQAQEWSMPEIVPVPSTHGVPAIWSRIYVPEGFDPARGEKYPAVMFVHGAGYLQNVHFGWSHYFREFLFHTYLTQHGYVVIDMDFRASAGYGRDWRTAIYRQMGIPELEDMEDGVAWLIQNRHVDPKRIGVYGGSYGGFMALMALFRQPDLFAAGAALRPVTDWSHYNHEYTANILNTPEDDPEAYHRSSPIEYAAGLTKPLLLCHGMVDDNVHFEDTVLLVQRLIELKKQNFETAVYPVEPHGFQEPTSWLDEYRRVFKLMELYVRNETEPLMAP